MEEGMQDGIKSEGWVLTDRASWRHNNGRVDTQKKQIKIQTHKHTKWEKKNRTNINKIRQKEIKVRTNDMLCWAQHISGTGKHDREDPVAFIHWSVFSKLVYDPLKVSLSVGHQCSIAFNSPWEADTSALQKHVNYWIFTARINEICNSTGGMCL